MGYRHAGKEWYLNRHGDVAVVNGWSRKYDRLKGFLMGLGKFKIDHFSDHSIDRYVEYIRKAMPDDAESASVTVELPGPSIDKAAD